MFTLYTHYALLCTGKAVYTAVAPLLVFCVQQYPHETHEMAVDYPTVTEPSVVKTCFFCAARPQEPRPNALYHRWHIIFFCPAGSVTWGSTLRVERMKTAT